MKSKKKDEITIRSSAAEYLTYIASVGDNPDCIEMRYEDENIWLTQKIMAQLYDVDVRTISDHIKKIYSDFELEELATIRKFQIVQSEGSRQVSRDTNHYNLQMIIAVGFKVNSERAVQFRKWVNQIARDYTIKGWVMDVERVGLTTWANAPSGKIKKTDVTVAKNYLSEFEMGQLDRLVSAYLDFAESMTRRHIPLTMQDRETRLNSFIEMFEYGILKDAGKVSAEIAKLHAETEFEKYRVIQDKLFLSDYDKYLLELDEQVNEHKK